MANAWEWTGSEATVKLLTPPASWRAMDAFPLLHLSATFTNSGYRDRDEFRFTVMAAVFGFTGYVDVKLPLTGKSEDGGL